VGREWCVQPHQRISSECPYHLVWRMFQAKSCPWSESLSYPLWLLAQEVLSPWPPDGKFECVVHEAVSRRSRIVKRCTASPVTRKLWMLQALLSPCKVTNLRQWQGSYQPELWRTWSACIQMLYPWAIPPVGPGLRHSAGGEIEMCLEWQKSRILYPSARKQKCG
jgi:hypothetical protein